MSLRRPLLALVVMIAALLVAPGVASAATPGALDSSFGVGGMVTSSFSGAVGDEFTDVAQLSTGELVAVGTIYDGTSSTGVLARYGSNGDQDMGFGNVVVDYSATVGFYTYATAVAVDGSDRIYVAGKAITASNNINHVVARYSSTGVLDTTWGVSGWAVIGTGAAGVDEGAETILVEADGTTFVGGYNFNSTSDLGVATLIKLLPTGLPDTAFDGDALRSFDVAVGAFGEDEAVELAIDASDQLVLAGTFSTGFGTERTFLARVDSSTGVLDSTFDTDGMKTLPIGAEGDVVSGVVTTPDRSIIVSGWEDYLGEAFTKQPVWLARVDASGAPAGSFGTGGIIRHLAPGNINTFAGGLVADAHGRLLVGVRPLVASPRHELGLIRVDATTGALDTSFGASGWATTNTTTDGKDVLGILRQSDAEVVVFGEVVDDPAFPDSFMARFVASDTPVVPDVTPPVAPVIGGAPTGSTTSTDAVITFASEPGATFACSLDGAAFATCVSPTTLASVVVGAHSFRVKAIDAANNTSPISEATWTVVTPTVVTPTVPTPVVPQPDPDPVPEPPRNPPLGQIVLAPGAAAKLASIGATGFVPVQLPITIQPGTTVTAKLTILPNQAKALGLGVPRGAKLVVIGSGKLVVPVGKAVAKPAKLALKVVLTRPAKAAFAKAAARGSQVRVVATKLQLTLTRDKVSARPITKPLSIKK